MMQKGSNGLRSTMTCFAVMLMFVLFIYGNVYATNGYFSHGYSLKNKAMAGAGVALPLDSEAASVNPAGMVFVGSRLDVGVSLFNPNREYTITGMPTDPSTVPGCPPACPFGLVPGTVESDSKWFVIPALGYNRMLDDNSSIGLSIYGNGGMNTDYDTATFNINPMLPSFGSSPTGVDLMQLFVVPTYARKFNQKHAWGISPIFAYQAFEAEGLQAFAEAGFSGDPAHLSNLGHETSYGVGVRAGYIGEFIPNVYFGASYQSRIYMSELDDYAGLFAKQGYFDIPSNWTIGLALKVSPAFTMTAEVQEIYYGEIDSINNPLLPNLMMAPLGSDSGAGFGWENMTIFKMGAQWQSSPDWTWRAGLSFGDQPIPESELMFNIIAPGVIETHATCGVTKKINDNKEIDLALMRAFSKSIDGPNPLDPAQSIELKMDQWEFSVGYSYLF